jgi:hypothetical protein
VTGDPCPKCESHIQVVNTFVEGESRVRYLGCRGCGFRPEGNKVVVPLVIAPSRLKMRRLATFSRNFG